MEEFLLIFRRDFATKEKQPSPEQMQNHLNEWQEWFRSLAAGNKLSRPLQRWDREGKVVRPGKDVINGPYAEIKESIGGMIFVKATDYDEAVEIAHGCPILRFGGNVEIRRASTPENN
jgi:hypothetical protein